MSPEKEHCDKFYKQHRFYVVFSKNTSAKEVSLYVVVLIFTNFLYSALGSEATSGEYNFRNYITLSLK